MRLNKYLSDIGYCSRREADRLIEAGKVYIDGIQAGLGMQVEEGQEVRVGKLAGIRIVDRINTEMMKVFMIVI